MPQFPRRHQPKPLRRPLYKPNPHNTCRPFIGSLSAEHAADHLGRVVDHRDDAGVVHAGRTDHADGVQIFIGAENSLFRHTGCSMIISPYHDQRRMIVGAIGVIGPTRMNYARIIPMVDYTAKLIGRLLD